jgi:hypothetical protein
MIWKSDVADERATNERSRRVHVVHEEVERPEETIARALEQIDAQRRRHRFNRLVASALAHKE